MEWYVVALRQAVAIGGQPVRAASATTGASEPKRTKTDGRRFDELDAYRGLAALLIVIFHAYQYSRQATQQSHYVYEGTPFHYVFGNLDAGVAWFFALSGFLLFMPIARAAIRQSEPQSTRGFLVRRAIRILPLYYVAILVVWSWRYTGGREQWQDLIQHLTFTHSFDQQRIFWTIGPAWSLAVEVHFYLVLAFLGPVLYRACRMFDTERARTFLLVAFVGGFGLFGAGFKWWAAFVAEIPESNSTAYFGFQAKMDDFAIGMMVGVIAAAVGGRQLVGRVGAMVLRFIGATIIVLAFSVRFVESVPRPITVADLYFHGLSAIGFALFLAAAVFGPPESMWGRVFTHPSLRFLGLVSYSVYLWHEPLLIELGKHKWLLDPAPDAFPLNAVILVALSLAVGAVSYVVIERPTMELRHLFTPKGRLALRA